ncbi:MAG TPA: hypothetical protein DEQ03_09795, partial [Marinilabiliales bacterium]|nr:hypothetical protein [Marinilabiliales bacterium]
MFSFGTVRIVTLFTALALFFPGKLVLSQEYNKRSDYVYNFENTDAKIVSVTIVNNTLELPVFTENYQTAFLEVDIRATFGNWLSQPKVELNSNGVNACQYFEFGAKGLRYINLSEFIQKKNSFIEFDFDRCHITNKKVRLILFKNPAIENKNLLVLAPHPDDAEIAAYGLYASNRNAFVATVTVGDAGKKMYDELYSNDTTHYLKKAGLRLWNSITVPMLAGLEPQNMINLGYFDASLKQMYSDTSKTAKARYTGLDNINIYREQNISSFLDSVYAAPNWRSLVNDLKYIVEKEKPSVIVTPYPAIDVHPDHKLTTVALIQGLKELNYMDVELWLYTNHYVYDEMYPQGKVRSLVALPPVTSEESVYFKRICSFTLSDNMQSDKALAL